MIPATSSSGDGSPSKPAGVRPPWRPRWWREVLSSEYLVLILSVAYFLAIWPFTPGLASAENLGNIFSNMLPLLVIAVGQTFVLITGGIDLSVISIIGLASVVGGSVMTSDGGLLGGSPLAAPAGMAAMFLVGTSAGLLSGLAIARTSMPPFIVTLTGQMFWRGLALWYANWYAQSVDFYNLPPAFIRVGQGRLLGPVTYALVVAAVIAAAAHVLLTRSLAGRWLYAVGRNPTASAISGVPVRRTIVLAYALSGACAAAASILYSGRLETASASHGERIFLDVIAAAVIGGTSLFGGKGKVLGTVFGVLFITLLDNTLSFKGLSNFSVLMVKGGVILLAAVIDAARVRLLAER